MKKCTWNTEIRREINKLSGLDIISDNRDNDNLLISFSKFVFSKIFYLPGYKIKRKENSNTKIPSKRRKNLNTY